MRNRQTWAGLVLSWLIVAAGAAHADDELARQATWSIPTAAQLRSQLDAFLQTQQLDENVLAKIDAIWPSEERETSASENLGRLSTIFALVNDEARKIVEFCDQQEIPVTPPEFELLRDEQQPAFLRNNLRLLVGQWLAQHRYYDESIALLDGLKPEDVVDPAALLFYQGTGHHRMPDKEKCLPIIARLLENEASIPRRYATVARLIQADLEPLKTDSLDEISRLMDEVERRLDLKRAGKRVRDQEEEVVDKLDKLIKKLEEQQQQSSAAASLSPSSPAQDSMPMGGKGPGDIDRKSIGTNAGWGNLPPKERQEALQQIGKDLPAHYREVIEEYFRKLAREGGTSS